MFAAGQQTRGSLARFLAASTTAIEVTKREPQREATGAIAVPTAAEHVTSYPGAGASKISRVWSIRYVPRHIAGITGAGQLGKFGMTSIPVPDISVTTVRHQYRYRTLR